MSIMGVMGDLFRSQRDGAPPPADDAQYDPFTGTPYPTAPTAQPGPSAADAYRMGGLANMQNYMEGPPHEAWGGYDKAIAKQDRQQAELEASPQGRAYLSAQQTFPGAAPRGPAAGAAQVAKDIVVPNTLGDAALMVGTGPIGRTAAVLGQIFDPSPAQAGNKRLPSGALSGLAGGAERIAEKGAQNWRIGDIAAPIEAQPGRGMTPGEMMLMRNRASPDEINRAALESAKGMSQPALIKLYDELGLTGGAPSELLGPSLAQAHTAGARQSAIDLKLADREELNKLTPKQRQVYRDDQKLPEGMVLPSQNAVADQLAEYDKVKKEVTRAEGVFDAGTNNRNLFDTSAKTLMRQPDVPQFQLPRIQPELTEQISPVDRGGLERLDWAARQAPVANWGWYNMMQARDLMHAIHGPQKGEQVFNAWLDGVAGTSMVNPIDNNIRSSTWYLQKILNGEALPETLQLRDPENNQAIKTMVGGPPPGYGAKSQIQHADRVREYLTNTYDPVSNPKPISYRSNLGGNWMPRTVDTHDVRNMLGMPYAKDPIKLLPKEYSYLEAIGQRASDAVGKAQAQQQAATWIGGGEYTGLKSTPQPLLDVVNRRAAVTGMVRGITPEQALHEAFTGKRPLLGVAGAAGTGALGAEMARGGMGSTVSPETYAPEM